jgi:hypothetical protein
MATYPTATLGQVINSTATCWASVRARVVQGTWKLGWYYSTTDTYVAIATISTGYVRTKGTAAPPHANAKLAIWSTTDDDADEVEVILWCCGFGSRIPDEVPSQLAAGSSTTKTQGALTTAHDPSNAKGTIDVTLTPRFWGTAAPTTAETILECTATEIVGLDGAGDLEIQDGTNEANADAVEADDTQWTARGSWRPPVLYAAKIGGDDGTAAYDNAWPAGNLEIKGTCRTVQGLVVYDLPTEDTVALPGDKP